MDRQPRPDECRDWLGARHVKRQLLKLVQLRSTVPVTSTPS